jgi:hypothetical protein
VAGRAEPQPPLDHEDSHRQQPQRRHLPPEPPVPQAGDEVGNGLALDADEPAVGRLPRHVGAVRLGRGAEDTERPELGRFGG